MTSKDVTTLTEHVKATIGATPDVWPGGWPDDIDTALIDAVFSARAKYGSRTKGKETGVFGCATRWRAQRPGMGNDLRVFADFGAERLAGITNRGKTSQRLKAQVVIDVADRLVRSGIVTADDFRAHEEDARAAYLSVKGCGPVTWAYLRMLLGEQDVKADTWVMRYVQGVLPTVTTSAEAQRLVSAVARELKVSSTDLDHAIWRYSSSHGT